MSFRNLMVTISMAVIVGIAVFNLDLEIRMKSAHAQATEESGWSPTQAAPKLDVYYPGTEALKPKVFISHLHVDHYGDLASFWLGGTTMNRLTPLRMWGPSGHTPEYGKAYAMQKMQEMYTWDIATRAGVIDFRGGQLEINEFPYETDNEVIFNENDVVIRSFPAIHALDGAVSFILEWNGFKIV